MKTSTNERSFFLRWTSKSLKYFFLGSIGFSITYIIPKIFGIEIIPSVAFELFVKYVSWRLGITILLLLGVAIVVESWR